MMILNLIAQFGDGFKVPGSGFFKTDATVGECGTKALTNFNDIISLIIGFLTVIAGLAFLLYFVFGGLQWALAGGDSGKVDSAKKQMTNGAIGLIIVIVAYGVIAVVGTVVGLDILNPGNMLSILNPVSGCPGVGGATVIVE